MKIENNKVNEVAPKQEPNAEELAAKQQQLMDACSGFESMFVSQLLNEMRKSIPKGNLFGESKGEELTESLMYDEYAKALSGGNGIGMANILYQQLKDSIK